MQESVVAIAQELHAQLETLMTRTHLGPPPKKLRENRRKVVLVGKVTKEQQAMALLYHKARTAHDKMHERTRQPFGVNPHVNSAHYRNHVRMTLLYEMFMWSVHRHFRRRTSGLEMLFDTEWNIYGPPPSRSRKKKTAT